MCGRKGERGRGGRAFGFGDCFLVTFSEVNVPLGDAPGIMGCFLVSQCRALSKRLALAEKSKEALTEEMKAASQNISRLQVGPQVLP